MASSVKNQHCQVPLAELQPYPTLQAPGHLTRGGEDDRLGIDPLTVLKLFFLADHGSWGISPLPIVCRSHGSWSGGMKAWMACMRLFPRKSCCGVTAH